MQQVPGTSGAGDTDKHVGEAAGTEEGGVGVFEEEDRRGGSGARGIGKVQGGGGLFVANKRGAYNISSSSPDDQAGLDRPALSFCALPKRTRWNSTLRGRRHFSLVARTSTQPQRPARPNANDLKGETTRKFTYAYFRAMIVPNNMMHDRTIDKRSGKRRQEEGELKAIIVRIEKEVFGSDHSMVKVNPLDFWYREWAL